MKHKQYQVLVDMFAMSRLSWTTWNMFSAPVQGNVAYNDNTFVGLMGNTSAGDQIIAELDYTRGLNGEYFYYVSEDEVTSDTSGLALVETEPIRYSLDNVQTISTKIVSSADIQLGSVYLERNDENQVFIRVSFLLKHLNLQKYFRMTGLRNLTSLSTDGQVLSTGVMWEGQSRVFQLQ